MEWLRHLEQLKKKFGFRSIHVRKEKVLIAVQKATEIRKNVEELARIKERAVLQNVGVEISESESPGNSSSESNDDGWCSNASTDNDKPNDERESCSPTCVFHESFQTSAAALNTGKFPDDTGEMTVEKQALEHYLDIPRECRLNWCAFVCTIDLEMEGIAEDALYKTLLGLNLFLFQFWEKSKSYSCDRLICTSKR